MISILPFFPMDATTSAYFKKSIAKVLGELLRAAHLLQPRGRREGRAGRARTHARTQHAEGSLKHRRLKSWRIDLLNECLMSSFAQVTWPITVE